MPRRHRSEPNSRESWAGPSSRSCQSYSYCLSPSSLVYCHLQDLCLSCWIFAFLFFAYSLCWAVQTRPHHRPHRIDRHRRPRYCLFRGRDSSVFFVGVVILYCWFQVVEYRDMKQRKWAAFEVLSHRIWSLKCVSILLQPTSILSVQIINIEYICMRVGCAYDFTLRGRRSVLVVASLAVGRSRPPEWRCSAVGMGQLRPHLRSPFCAYSLRSIKAQISILALVICLVVAMDRIGRGWCEGWARTDLAHLLLEGMLAIRSVD